MYAHVPMESHMPHTCWYKPWLDSRYVVHLYSKVEAVILQVLTLLLFLEFQLCAGYELENHHPKSSFSSLNPSLFPIILMERARTGGDLYEKLRSAPYKFVTYVCMYVCVCVFVCVCV